MILILKKQPSAVFIRTLKEIFVDIYHQLKDALLNHATTFSVKIVMQNAKHIYQLVIYQHPQHVRLLEQDHVILMQLQEMMQPEQHFAIHI